jgi:hypothetical protein
MHSFKPATHRGGRIPCFLLLAVFLSFVSLHSEAAYSASLNVKIRQLNHDGAVQQVTCAEKQKCELPLDIQTGSTKQTLTVSVLFATPRMMIRFQTPKGLLYAGTTTPDNKSHYEAFWPRTLSQGQTSTENVTLYSLAGPTPIIVPIVDADREAGLKITHSVVATLEITTQTAP